MKYVLISQPYGPYGSTWDGYYTGRRYTFQREQYAVCSTDIKDAKIYTSAGRANLAAEKLNRSVNNYKFDCGELTEALKSK